MPGVKPPPVDDEDGAVEDEDDAVPLPRVVAEGRAGGVDGRGCAFGVDGWCCASACADCLAAAALRRICSPRWRKNSAMESALSYVLPA